MPRARAKGPAVRSDGEATRGNVLDPGGGQPNGRPPRAAVTQAAAGAGVGAPMPYGQKGTLQADAANTPLPPEVSQDGPGALAHAAHQALANYHHGVTPLFAPTQNPMEPVNAGAPLAPGPTNPMAMPMPDPGAVPVATLLEQAANATGNPHLRALAAQASAVATAGAAQASGSGSPFGP